MSREPFFMRVEDVFGFSDGRTVFVGLIAGTDAWIGSCWCELLHNDTVVERFEIEGQMIADWSPRSERALSTLASVAVTSEDVKHGGWVLRRAGDNFANPS
jgi:hypothetical protein